MHNKIINKVCITAEAKFDYEEEVALSAYNEIQYDENDELIVKKFMPQTDIKMELEIYIDDLYRSGQILYDNYFRIRYFDDDLDKELMLFIYKGNKFNLMQIWNVAGICESKDWSQELEDDGSIRNWLKATLNTTDKIDWVVDYRINKEIQDKEIAEYEI